MQTIGEYEAAIRILLGDENRKRYSETMIHTAMRTALTEYSRFFPGRSEPPQNDPQQPAAEDGIPSAHAVEICRGAAGYAMQIRAAAVTEVFGRRSEDVRSLLQQGETLCGRYRKTLAALSLTETGNPALPDGAGFPP